jgi:hypothetical protein
MEILISTLAVLALLAFSPFVFIVWVVDATVFSIYWRWQRDE